MNTKFPIKGSNLQIREYSSSNKFILNQPYLYRNYFDLNIEVYKKHSMVVYDNVNSPISNIIIYNSEKLTPAELASVQDNNNSITTSEASEASSDSEVLNTLSSLNSKGQGPSKATTNKRSSSSWRSYYFSLYNTIIEWGSALIAGILLGLLACISLSFFFDLSDLFSDKSVTPEEFSLWDNNDLDKEYSLIEQSNSNNTIDKWFISSDAIQDLYSNIDNILENDSITEIFR